MYRNVADGKLCTATCREYFISVYAVKLFEWQNWPAISTSKLCLYSQYFAASLSSSRVVLVYTKLHMFEIALVYHQFHDRLSRTLFANNIHNQFQNSLSLFGLPLKM